jgi:hypothetical protein
MFDPLKIINNTTNMILLILFTIFQLTERIFT